MAKDTNYLNPNPYDDLHGCFDFSNGLLNHDIKLRLNKLKERQLKCLDQILFSKHFSHKLKKSILQMDYYSNKHNN